MHVPVTWDTTMSTSKVRVEKSGYSKSDIRQAKGTTSFFYSEFGSFIGHDKYGYKGPTQFGADNFIFRMGAEHTV